MSLYNEFKGFLIIPLVSGIGIILAMIFEVMYDNGWIIDEFIVSTITLGDLQMVIVVLFVIIGVFVGVFRR